MKQFTIEGIKQSAYDRLSRDFSRMIETGAGSLMLRTFPRDKVFDYTLFTWPEIVVITKEVVSFNMRTEDGEDIPISLRHSEYSKIVF